MLMALAVATDEILMIVLLMTGGGINVHHLGTSTMAQSLMVIAMSDHEAAEGQ